ncbi:hypothetical protein DFJ74DRAFT_768965 [Hyaloraphidium curvatum]|nr:hypothetical protein DFJ74DRAFT_768965 [Hyaloraphidium curvatum]
MAWAPGQGHRVPHPTFDPIQAHVGRDPPRDNMRTATRLLIAAALAVAAPLTAASPTPGAVFKRSCSDCDTNSFCEFGYPGTPEGSVACVAETVSRSAGLYRRYAPVWEECGTGDGICSGTVLVGAGQVASFALCQAACDANAQCVAFLWYGPPLTTDCMLYSSIVSHSSGDVPVGSRTGSKVGCGTTLGSCPA